MFVQKRKYLGYKFNNIVLGVFAFIGGLAYSLARQIVYKNRVGINLGETIAVSIIWFLILMLILRIIYYVENSTAKETKLFNKKKILVLFFINLCINLICLLTYFPGVGMNDGLNIMYNGMSASRQFPVLYCFILTKITDIGKNLGNLQYSVAIYSILQIVCVSAIYTWMMVWFFKKCAPKLVKYLIIAYFLVEPLLAMYAISMLKDTLFSLLLLAFIMISYDLVIEKEKIMRKKYWVGFFIVLFGILSLRNNGAYIVFPMLVILFVFSTSNRKGIICMIIGSSLVFLMQKVLMSYFGTVQMFQELVGIPLQQIVAVVANNGKIAPAEVEFLNTLMPLKEMAAQYNPFTVDVIKWNAHFNTEFLNEHKLEFLITWAKMLPENFLIYVKAYLQQTFWFWAPWQEGTVQCLYSIETVSDNSWLVEFLKTSGIHDQPLLPAQLNNLLRSWYQLGNKFFREGVCFWIMLSTLVLSVLKNRNWRMILVYAPALLLWLTIMISTPVAESMRYVFVFAYALPFFVGVLFIKREVKDVNI